MKTNSILSPVTLKAVILHDHLKDFLHDTKKDYSINKSKVFACFVTDFINYVIKKNRLGKFPNTATVKEAFNVFGLATVDDWILFFQNNKKELSKQKFNLNCFHMKTKKSIIKTKFYTEEDWLAAQKGERAVVLRSQYGGYQVMISSISLFGPMSSLSNPIVNKIKMDYHRLTGCPYYQVRPILFSTWNALSENDPRRNATCEVSVIGRDD